MARIMPALAADFQVKTAEALKISEVGEVAKVEALAGSDTKRDLSNVRLEYIYELSYLKMFYLWEDFLEQVFVRYACGYQSSVGTPTVKPGITLPASIAAAQVAVQNGRRYVLWHNPAQVVCRSQRFFTTCPLEAVIQSNLTRLEQLAAVRHRIVHAQADARTNFDSASMAIAGKRYPGGRVGAFLRDEIPIGNPGPPRISVLALELQGMANQIA